MTEVRPEIIETFAEVPVLESPFVKLYNMMAEPLGLSCITTEEDYWRVIWDDEKERSDANS